LEDPLHHFELHRVAEIHLFGLDLSINQGVLTMWLAVAAVFALFAVAAAKRETVPGMVQNIAEIGVEFIRDMAEDNIGPNGHRYVPFLVSLFVFVLFLNMWGLLPGQFTVTSQLVVTATLAIAVYAISLGVGFYKHGIGFLRILVPGGTPGWLIPLMIPVEILSQLARPLSLAVRLFANMTAGHTILAVLFGMALSLPLWAGWLPFSLTVLINALELFIAFIQAYIFVMLSCVYFGDAENLAH
jgi:F-type H+-transporting ATPase subunit a